MVAWVCIAAPSLQKKQPLGSPVKNRLSAILVFSAIGGMRCKYSSYTDQHLVQRVSFCSKVANQDARFCCGFLIPHHRKTKEKGVKSAEAQVYSALFVLMTQCVPMFAWRFSVARSCVPFTLFWSRMHVLELQASVVQNDPSWIFRISGWTLRGHCW